MKPRLTLIDVLISSGLVLLFASFLGAQLGQNIEVANRVKCASNLRQLGQAMLLYSNENRNAFPRTTFDAAKPPTWGTPYEANPKLGAFAKADPFAKPGKPGA